jgi:hypothetical protein
MTVHRVPRGQEEFLLGQLEELARKLGIAVRYEQVTLEKSSGAGGLCRIKGNYALIIHSLATAREKIQLITEALKSFDLSDMYIKPALREWLEGSGE